MYTCIKIHLSISQSAFDGEEPTPWLDIRELYDVRLGFTTYVIDGEICVLPALYIFT